MDELSATIRRCNLPLKFDNKTEGYGNCFPNTIVQQCRRPEIKTWLQEKRPWAVINNQQTLRIKITQFSLNPRYKAIIDLKNKYDEEFYPANNISWRSYWNEMAKEGTWVNHLFVQVTAWYLGLDIQILTTSATQNSPFIFIYGNVNKTEEPAPGPPILIGNYTNVHYQSLLPLINEANEEQEHQSKCVISKKNHIGKKKPSQNESEQNNFTFIHGEDKILFSKLVNEKFLCPFCGVTFARLVTHIASKKCKIKTLNIDASEFKKQLNSFREGFILEMSRTRKEKHLAKKMEEKGKDIIKAEQNRWKLKSRTKLKENKGTEVIKAEQNKWKVNSRKILREEKGTGAIKEEQNQYKQISQAKLIADRGLFKMKQDQNARKLKSQAKLIAKNGPVKMKEDQKTRQLKSQAKLIADRGPFKMKEDQNARKLKSQAKQNVERGPVKMKEDQNARKLKSQAKIIVEKGPVKLKEEQNTRKLKSLKQKMENDPKTLRNENKDRKKLSRRKQRKEDPKKVKEDQNKWQLKLRIVETDKKRLKKFRERTMFNAIFTCICCHRNLFDCNVSKFTPKLSAEIETKKHGLIEKAIVNSEEPIVVNVNGKEASYLCHACKKHLKSGKLPPMSAMNGLNIYNHDPELELTELEANLIAKNIVFMKIFMLPKSRWTALKDKIINVPVKDDDIVNTMTRLPRTPNEAGLIEVDLKRKVEFKNSHQRQLINPEKCFKMLELLKQAGNIHYQFYDDYNIYTERCKKQDFTGYIRVFEEEVELIRDISQNSKQNKEKDEVCIEEILEEEYIKKDPVRKYQFEGYNKSLCLSNMYPEAENINSVIVAPGEGKVPKNVLYDDDWDIKAFPHLNSPDGKYGLHHVRQTRLTDQYYFIQRICNTNPKFANSPAYVYAAVAHTELKQIQRNVNVSYSRGKEIGNKGGIKTLQVDDPYAVLDDIKQTPRYWRKAKYEMFAKLDNFGPFHFFFTLSCADLRWKENFAAILRDKEGCKLRYIIQQDNDGYPQTEVYVDFKKNHEHISKKIETYLKEEGNESLHECIRGHVLLATRYFNHRVKSFMSEIVMGGGNPMSVDKYSYKAEFQERGAGHVHGTLWVKLNVIETMRKLKDGSLVTKAKYKKKKMKEDFTKPFEGLVEAFKKFKYEEFGDLDDDRPVINFIDQFTTVSLNEDEVGKEEAEIVEEVNKHLNTKTCNKTTPNCRFRYPKFPIWTTILVRPYKSELDEEKDKNLKYYEDILKKVRELLEDEELIIKIMCKYNKRKETKEEYNLNRRERIFEFLLVAEVNPNHYLLALKYSRAGYSVHLKRDLDEIYINSYNIEWIRAWNGNLDIQPCFDHFAVITYVTEYFVKDESGTIEVLRQVIESNPDDSTKDKMKKVASTFLSHRQIGEAEAFFKLLPDLLLKNSNVTCQWLYVGRKAERFTRMKKADEDEKANEIYVKLEGVKGLWYEQPDMLSKYKRRPDTLEEICSSHFAKIIKSGGKNIAIVHKEEIGPDEEIYDPESEDDDSTDDEDPNEKFHNIITEADDPGEEIPKYFKLKDPYPKENPIMQRRSFPAALRFHKVNRDNNPHKYFLSELMLYIPFRDEEKEFRPDDPNFIQDLYMKNEDRIKKIKNKVMEHLESVEEARHYVNEVTKKLDLTKIGVTLDAAAELENAECKEELGELHPDYVHLDTDNVEIIEEDINRLQNIYRSIDLPNINTLKYKTRQLDPYQRNVVDIGVKYAKDILKAQREENQYPEPPYLMVHGGAGAGKTFVIQTLAEWIQYILQKSGDESNCPYVIKTAFTGTAASLIEGMTLHSAFGFSFENKHYSLSDKTRDARRNIMRNLKMIIIDEISMVKADMLYQLDLRLQEIMQKIGVAFGGISVFCFGDILQLKPVCGKYIFDRPQNSSFFLTFELDSRWHKFSVMNLEINHRQGRDKQYAEMLNRVREGKQTEEDIDKLKEQIRPYGHADLDEVSLYIVCTKRICCKINTTYLENLPGSDVFVKARHYHPTQKNYKPRICKKEGTVGTSSFMDNLRVKIGCKIILIHNIDTADGLTNGQLGKLLEIIRTEDGSIAKIIVEFKKENVGKQNREKNPQFKAMYPRGTIIEKVGFKYSLSKKASTGSTATVFQFPLKVAHAITAHKIQGQTISKPLKVALDISSIFEDAQAHVMLSRVEEFEQIYILDDLPAEKIRASPKALTELEEMNVRSINQNPIPWKQKNENYIKIASMNCMNLKNNYEDIICDPTLMESTLLAFSETWMEENTTYNINGFRAHFNSIGPGKGLAIYYKQGTFKHTIDIRKAKMQITKMECTEMEIIAVYRSEQGNSSELLEEIKNLITPGMTTIVCGDFNICYMSNRNNKVTHWLEENEFAQLMKDATHIKGRHIDHFYFRPSSNITENASVHRYSPYYSDHDAICVTITKPQN